MLRHSVRLLGMGLLPNVVRLVKGLFLLEMLMGLPLLCNSYWVHQANSIRYLVYGASVIGLKVVVLVGDDTH